MWLKLKKGEQVFLRRPALLLGKTNIQFRFEFLVHSQNYLHAIFQVIDRYKFMSLLPLTSDELKSIGYQSLSVSSGNRQGIIPAKTSSSVIPTVNGHSTYLDPEHIPRPDFSQMVPFKPKVNWRPGEFIVPGGTFPLPPAAQELVQILPPPTCFNGPHVIVEKLCEIFDKIRLPETFQPASSSSGNGHSTKLFDLSKSVHWIVDQEMGKKRKSHGPGDEDSDDDSNISAPSNDIYRKRQQKKIK